MKQLKLNDISIVKSEKDDQKALDAALSSLNLDKRLENIDKVVIKINLVVAEPYTLGSVSDPMVLEGIIREIQKYSKTEIIIAEAETAWCPEMFMGKSSEKPKDCVRGWELALKNSGTQEILDKYPNVRILDVTRCEKAQKEEIEELVTDHRDKIDPDMLSMVPAEFLEDNILFIDYAKMKTHRFYGTGSTATCKNMMGFITTPSRVPYHDGGKGLLNSILSINLLYSQILKNRVGIAECLRYTIEGDGPDTEKGHTKMNAGLIVTGENFLEIDTVCTHLIKIDPKVATYLETLKICYPEFDIDLSSIPNDFIVPFEPPTHWEGNPSW